MNESKELVSFLELSEEMALHIFKYCTLQTKYFLTSTSKFCRRVVCDDELKLVCFLKFSPLILCSRIRKMDCWTWLLLWLKGKIIKGMSLRRLLKSFIPITIISGLFILRSIIHIFPTCPDVWKEVGLCYKQMDDFENAIEALFIALDVCLLL